MNLDLKGLRKAPLVLAALALVVAGCSKGNDESKASSSGGLAGKPIKLGSILTITNPAWDNGSVAKVNTAWASHINEDLGGINGRPVQIESCDDQGDPAKTTQCLKNLIDSGVVGFVNNSSLAFGANALASMEASGYVNLGGWPVSPDETGSKDYNFPTSPGASGSYPSLAVFFRGNKAQKLAVAYTNTPSGKKVGDALDALWKSLGGTSYFATEFDPKAPDFTPVMSKLAAQKPDAVILAVGAGPAPRMFQAARVAGITAPMGASATPATKDVLNSAKDAAKGIYFAFAAVPADFDSPDAKSYRDVMSKYASGVDLTNQTAVAASSAQYAYEVLKSVSGDVTKDSIRDSAQKMTSWKGFLTHAMDSAGAPQALPAIANPYNLVAQWNGSTFVPATIADDTGLTSYVDKQGSLNWIAGYPPQGH